MPINKGGIRSGTEIEGNDYSYGREESRGEDKETPKTSTLGRNEPVARSIERERGWDFICEATDGKREERLARSTVPAENRFGKPQVRTPINGDELKVCAKSDFRSLASQGSRRNCPLPPVLRIDPFHLEPYLHQARQNIFPRRALRDINANILL
ncbi:hypothetical protein KM043_001814 [Ampulex compressa]|nr:hypothetical protein KM043_001814 [Ampulex compressa]